MVQWRKYQPIVPCAAMASALLARASHSNRCRRCNRKTGVRLTSTADIVVVYDAGGVVTDCNEPAASLLGYPAPDITGQPMAQIIPLRLRSEHRAQTQRLF